MPMLCKGSNTLKVKRDLNYRKGNKERNCGNCISFVPKFEINEIGKFTHRIIRKIAPRCKIIGLETSIRYQVNAKNVCNAHTKEETNGS